MKLAPGEVVLKIYRQTGLVPFGYFLIALIAGYLPWYFLQRYELLNDFSKFFLAWLIICSIYFLNHLILWRLNYALLTNKRILLVTYHNLLHKQVTDLPEDKIVNVAYEKKGILPALFDYGNVIIQQQSLNMPVELKRLAEPELIKDEILSLNKGQNLDI